MDLLALTPFHIGWPEALMRIAAAIVLSLAVGLERFLRKKPVDFRPFVVISLASSALSLSMLEMAAQELPGTANLDPAKLFSGIMTGIGFLGAGALFREKHIVEGAGSASAVWASGAIGIICGIGFIWLAGLVALGMLVLFIISNPFTDRYEASPEESRRRSGGRDSSDRSER